jgi:hypothetical protein
VNALISLKLPRFLDEAEIVPAKGGRYARLATDSYRAVREDPRVTRAKLWLLNCRAAPDDGGNDRF